MITVSGETRQQAKRRISRGRKLREMAAACWANQEWELADYYDRKAREHERENDRTV